MNGQDHHHYRHPTEISTFGICFGHQLQYMHILFAGRSNDDNGNGNDDDDGGEGGGGRAVQCPVLRHTNWTQRKGN